MKKLIVAGSAVAALAFAGTAAAGVVVPSSDGVEGCAQAGAGSCTYSPTSAGGIAAHGNWSVTLTFSNGSTPVTLSNAAKQACAQWSPNSTGATYNNVATVTLNVADNQSGGAIGDPFPTQAQSAGSGQTAC